MNWLGYELLKVDKYDHALAVFHQIIAENPSSAEAYGNLGEAYLQQHDKANAISAFQRAVDLGLKGNDVPRKLAGSTSPGIGLTRSATRCGNKGRFATVKS